jgi:hypothetical protein
MDREADNGEFKTSIMENQVKNPTIETDTSVETAEPGSQNGARLRRITNELSNVRLYDAESRIEQQSRSDVLVFTMRNA